MIDFPTTEELRKRFPEDEELEGGFGPDDLTTGQKARLRELPDDTITIFANWEGTICASLENDDLYMLNLLDDGRVGFGGINQPVFYNTVDELRESV